jgi:hypothetical protein
MLIPVFYSILSVRNSGRHVCKSMRGFTVKRHTLLVNRGTALRSAPSLRVCLQTILALAQGSANAGSD